MTSSAGFYFLSGLGGYIGVAVSLVMLSGAVPALEFYGRLMLALLSIIACAIYGVVASAVLRLAGYSGLSQWTVARSFKWTMRYTTDVRFEIENEAGLSVRPAVFVGNHQTELDILMLGAIFPPYCSVTAKKSLQWVPFLGWFMTLSNTVFIDRANRETAKAAFDGAAAQMHSQGQSVYIFPEGTRSYAAEPLLLPFKKGAFHLAVQAQVPIVPVVVANYAHVLSFKKRVFKSGRVPVKVLDKIETKGMTAADVDELTQRVRTAMLAELEKLTASAPGRVGGKQAAAVPVSASASRATGADLGAEARGR